MNTFLCPNPEFKTSCFLIYVVMNSKIIVRDKQQVSLIKELNTICQVLPLQKMRYKIILNKEKLKLFYLLYT